MVQEGSKTGTSYCVSSALREYAHSAIAIERGSNGLQRVALAHGIGAAACAALLARVIRVEALAEVSIATGRKAVGATAEKRVS